MGLMEGGNHGEGELNMGGCGGGGAILWGTQWLWGTHFGDAPIWVQWEEGDWGGDYGEGELYRWGLLGGTHLGVAPVCLLGGTHFGDAAIWVQWMGGNHGEGELDMGCVWWCGGHFVGDPFWGCSHLGSMEGGNHGEGELYVRGFSEGGNNLGVVPIWVQWGKGTMGRGNRMWRVWWWWWGPNSGGDPMVMGDPFWGCTHLGSMEGGILGRRN